MLVPLNWLRDYVTVDVPVDELAERLTISVAGVERIIRRGVADEDGNLGLYRVGRVLQAGKHPNADRLQLCTVDVGDGEPRQIVCGAWNFAAGATVAVALTQSRLASDVKAGENAGKRLVHDHVVRAWHAGAPIGAAGELRQHFNLPLPTDRGPLEIVAFAENTATGEVLQALAMPVCTR